MLLGFKVRFEPKVKSGLKTHSIRAKRKRRPRAGEICHCYTGLRQKGARLLGRWRCVKVQDIRIKGFFPTYGPFTGGIFIDDQLLSQDELEALARSDGFANFEDMIAFWKPKRKKGPRLDFHGDMIHWDFNQPCEKPAKGKRRAAAS